MARYRAALDAGGDVEEITRALIAGLVSYLHMHLLVARHGQPGLVAAFTPLPVDGMIVAASTMLLADSRSGGNGGVLPWALLVAGSIAGLAVTVAVAGAALIGRWSQVD